MMGRSLLVAAWVVFCGFALAACGDDDDDSLDCKSACDVLASCNLSSSGFSCDDDCKQWECADCIHQSSCSDIQSGACGSSCPGASFKPK